MNVLLVLVVKKSGITVSLEQLDVTVWFGRRANDDDRMTSAHDGPVPDRPTGTRAAGTARLFPEQPIAPIQNGVST